MPCHSQYLEPSKREKEAQKVAQLLLYVWNELGKTHNIPTAVLEKVQHGAQSIYGGTLDVDNVTALLCANCQEVELLKLEDRVIYDGRNPEARRLADWWDEHKAFDKSRK